MYEQVKLVKPNCPRTISIVKKFCAGITLASCIIPHESRLKQLEVIRLNLVDYIYLALKKCTFILIDTERYACFLLFSFSCFFFPCWTSVYSESEHSWSYVCLAMYSGASLSPLLSLSLSWPNFFFLHICELGFRSQFLHLIRYN